MEAKLIKMMEGYIVSVTRDIDDIYAITNKELAEEHGFYYLSLKNCQAIEHGYDLDELTEESIIQFVDKNEQVGLFDIGFLKGFQKALEILGDKKFTYNQMVSAITESSISHRLPSLIIQDLQQTEWDCIIEMEKVKDETKIIGAVKGVKGSGDKITTYKSIPKLDSDGCLILKRK